MARRISGIIPAMITPYRPDGTADAEAMGRLVEIGVCPGVKAALRLQGLDVGACRRPFARLTPDQEARLARALERLG